jgi:hypothetical protein
MNLVYYESMWTSENGLAANLGRTPSILPARAVIAQNRKDSFARDHDEWEVINALQNISSG